VLDGLTRPLGLGVVTTPLARTLDAALAPVQPVLGAVAGLVGLAPAADPAAVPPVAPAAPPVRPVVDATRYGLGAPATPPLALPGGDVVPAPAPLDPAPGPEGPAEDPAGPAPPNRAPSAGPPRAAPAPPDAVGAGTSAPRPTGPRSDPVGSGGRAGLWAPSAGRPALTRGAPRAGAPVAPGAAPGATPQSGPSPSAPPPAPGPGAPPDEPAGLSGLPGSPGPSTLLGVAALLVLMALVRPPAGLRPLAVLPRPFRSGAVVALRERPG
jgi:hypothetical protein